MNPAQAPASRGRGRGVRRRRGGAVRLGLLGVTLVMLAGCVEGSSYSGYSAYGGGACAPGGYYGSAVAVDLPVCDCDPWLGVGAVLLGIFVFFGGFRHGFRCGR